MSIHEITDYPRNQLGRVRLADNHRKPGAWMVGLTVLHDAGSTAPWAAVWFHATDQAFRRSTFAHREFDVLPASSGRHVSFRLGALVWAGARWLAVGEDYRAQDPISGGLWITGINPPLAPERVQLARNV